MVTPSILPLRAENVEVRRHGKRLIGPVTLQIAGQGITIILGPNGSGKTTLLRTLHGLDRARQGRVTWAVPLAEAQAHQAFVFQAPIVLRRSVCENIAFPLTLVGVPAAQARQRAQSAAALVGLADRLDLAAADLSGGEKQKMALARALIRDPQILFLDEPCANLDGAATRDIEAVLVAARDRGTRIVMSTHNIGQARRLACDVVFMFRGIIHEQGQAPEFFATPQTPETRAHLNGDLLT